MVAINRRTVVGIAVLGSIIGITLFSFTFVFNPPAKEPEPTMEYIPDTDSDGVPDDQDFFPNGNGRILINVAHFKGYDNCKNLLGKCDPEFRILVDEDGNGKLIEIAKQSVQDRNEIDNPISVVYDVPDDWTRVRFEIRIKDLDGGEWIDIWADNGNAFGLIEANLRSGIQTWVLSGDHDACGEITVEFSVV